MIAPPRPRAFMAYPLPDLLAPPRGCQDGEVRRRPVGVDVREAAGHAAGLPERRPRRPA